MSAETARSRAGSAGVLSLAACCLALVACGTPVPPEKTDYVGRWEGPGMQLLITQEGRVEYLKKKGRSSTSIKAPLQRFEGDDFVVGVWRLSTTFDVAMPPYEEDGEWKMVVEGVELTKLR